jgi:hypothetical protein
MTVLMRMAFGKLTRIMPMARHYQSLRLNSEAWTTAVEHQLHLIGASLLSPTPKH